MRTFHFITITLLVIACTSPQKNETTDSSDQSTTDGGITDTDTPGSDTPDSEDSAEPDTEDSSSTDTQVQDTNTADTATLPEIDYPTDYEPQPCSGPVEILDPALELALSKCVNFDVMGGRWGTPYEGEITGEMLAEVDSLLFAQDEGIEFLGGIECVTTARHVNLQNNFFSDVRLLSGMTQTEIMYLAGNDISDVEPLSGLSSLLLLDLSDNPIADPSPLATLSNLMTLKISNTGISSLDWVIGIEGLEGIVANDNAISDLTPLIELPNLVGVELNDNEIVDLSPLATMAQPADGFFELRVSGNRIVDIAPLQELKPTGLDISRNKVSDISPLGTFIDEIGRLYLHENQIEDLSVFAGSPEVDAVLTLYDNHIYDLSPLVGTGFSTRFEEYDFSKNHISDLTPLAGFGDFYTLDISDNRVEDLSPLAEKDLQFLYAARNNLHSLSSLLGVPLSDELDVTDNRISSVAPLLAAERARGWVLPGWISLLGNPLDQLALEEQLPILCESRRADIYFGDGETCPWSTSSHPLPEYDPDPAPVDTIEATQPEECPAAPHWLSEGALPGTSRGEGEMTVSGTTPSDAIVIDQVTGLEWRRCSEGQVFENGTCQGIAPAYSIEDAANLCTRIYGDRDDWRMPSVSELLTIADFSIAYPGPVVNAALFPETYPGFYWGGSERPFGLVNFYNGTVDIAFDGTARVRCVRGGTQGTLAERFEVSTEDADTVIDTWTGLEWRRCAAGQTWDGESCYEIGERKTFEKARATCAEEYAGHSDWRLPTIRELFSLINPCGADPAAYSTAFPRTPQSVFWSETEFPDIESRHWSVSFIYGWTDPLDDSELSRIRCVRKAD